MPQFSTLDKLDVSAKKVLLRADLNVPLHNGMITDESRLSRLVPTLKALTQAKAKVVILSHFGRPDGKRVEQLSLRPVAAALEKIWGQPIMFADDCIGPKAQAAIDALQPGHILVLENTRFYPGEEANDPDFASKLAALGDIYVNDAFSAAHRAHASTEALAKLLPSAAGYLMQEELQALEKALTHPKHPVAALVGGSKVSTKLDLLENLVTKVDLLALGGGMANTFLAAQGVAIGKSLHEANMLGIAQAIVAKAKAHKCRILLPVDAVVATELKANTATRIVFVSSVPTDSMILDLGPDTEKLIIDEIGKCQTLIWNGPLGAFEIPPFDHSTNAIAQAVAAQTQGGTLMSVAGGGDIVSALNHAHLAEKFSYVSTAGGAFLEWLEGKTLPGVAALIR
jgi:phosphoglycerate kinase